jgi:hypothetical protein
MQSPSPVGRGVGVRVRTGVRGVFSDFRLIASTNPHPTLRATFSRREKGESGDFDS